MKYIYQATIISLLFIMSYEFWFFEQHYTELLRELEVIRKVCKVDLGPTSCSGDACPYR